MGTSRRQIAKAIKAAAKKPTAPVDAPGTTGYEELVANAAEAAATRHNNRSAR